MEIGSTASAVSNPFGMWGSWSGYIQYTFETFALFGFDGILLPPRFLIRLGAATGARPSSGFEQGLYNRAIWGV